MRAIPVTPSMDMLPLGRLGENERTQIVFDVSDWLEEYPGASISLTNKLPHSSDGYPCTMTSEGDGKYSWTITSAELTTEGDGECQLQAVKGDVVVKGKIYKTKIGKALDGSAEVPDPWESWITELTELQGEAEDAAEDADEAASDAEAYAVGTRGGTDVDSSDPAYHNNSKYYAEQAGSSATSAAGSATTAGNKASDSEAYAVGKRGGVDVESGDAAYHNNSKYYSEQAAGSATAAAASAAQAGSKANRSVIAKEYADLTFPVTKGTWCFHEGVLYEANQAISTSEAWTAAHWTEQTVEGSTQSVLSEINTTADDVDDIKELLEISDPVVGYTFPDAYKSANYSNSKGTAQYKYVNDKLYMKKAEAFGEVSTSSASISNNASAAYVVDGSKNVYLPIAYVNDNDANIARLLIRYYDDSFNSSTTAYVYLPVGTGEMTVELVKLATDNNINLSQKKNVILRGLSLAETQGVEPGSAEVTFDGFGVEQSAENKIEEIDDRLDALEGRANNAVSSSTAGNNPQFYDEFCAHLFLNTTSDNTSDIYVPSQSLYDIEISKRLGFKVIEVNTHATSDGKYVCLHGTGGTFGTEFGAAEGSTYSDADVQGTTIAEVTMDWIKTNVRCRAKYPKYRTAPLSLEEFLLGCKQLNMVPRINYKGQDQIAIANGIMGKDNYILYGASKYVRPYTNAPILGTSRFESKQEVLDWMAGVGNPVIWNPLHLEDFTDAQWKEIIEAVHNFGGMITFPTGYADVNESQHFLNMGFDCGTSGFYLNKCNSGNMANLSADDSFSEFTVSGGTASDGQLTMTQNGTITNATALSQVFLSGMWLDITYKGSISVSMGRWITHSDVFTSADGETIHLSTYGINLAPTFQIKATENDTIIENIVFKASKL